MPRLSVTTMLTPDSRISGAVTRDPTLKKLNNKTKGLSRSRYLWFREHDLSERDHRAEVNGGVQSDDISVSIVVEVEIEEISCLARLILYNRLLSTRCDPGERLFYRSPRFWGQSLALRLVGSRGWSPNRLNDLSTGLRSLRSPWPILSSSSSRRLGVTCGETILFRNFMKHRKRDDNTFLWKSETGMSTLWVEV